MYCQNPDTIPVTEAKKMSAQDVLELAIRQKEYF
jgi:pyruvate-formate lyase-activating enzyme